MESLLSFKTLFLYSYNIWYQNGQSIPNIDFQDEGQIKKLGGSSISYEILEQLTDPGVARRRLGRGDLLFYFQQGEKILSWCWVSCQATSVGELGQMVLPQQGEAYIYDAFTRARWRGKNIFPALLSEILKYLATQRYSRALIFTLKNNVASRQGIVKVGFSCFQKIRYLNFFGLPFYIYGPKKKGEKGVLIKNSN